MDFRGVIVEESLQNTAVLKKIKVLDTKVEPTTEADQTPWLTYWTLHNVEVPEDQAEQIAEEVRKSLETWHSSWYADFKNDKTHYIIFPKKIFKIDRKKKEEYQTATDYGISLGIPDYQLDFSTSIPTGQ